MYIRYERTLYYTISEHNVIEQTVLQFNDSQLLCHKLTRALKAKDLV